MNPFRSGITLLALVALPAAAVADGTLTLGGETLEFETHGCQMPSGPDDPMASMLPRIVMTGTTPDGKPSRIDIRAMSGQRIEYSADGEMLYSTVWRNNQGQWKSARGAEDGPLFRVEDGVLTATAHFQSKATGDWVEGSLTAQCD